MNIFLVGYFGAGNLGDELALKIFLQGVSEPEYRIFALTHGKTPIPSRVNPVYYRNLYSVYDAIRRSHLVIFLCGDLLQTRWGWKSALYYLSLAHLSLRLTKRVFLLSQTLDPELASFLKKYLFILAPHTQAITLRDQFSFHYAQQYPFRKIRLTADWTFLSGLSNTSVPQRKEECVVIARKIRGASIQNWRFLLQKIPSPMSFLAIQPEDASLCHLLSREVPSSRILQYSSDEDKIAEILREARSVYSARLHGLLLGILQGTPVVGIGSLPKIRYFCEEMDIPIFSFISEKLEQANSFVIPKQVKWDKIEKMKERARGNWEVLPFRIQK